MRLSTEGVKDGTVTTHLFWRNTIIIIFIIGRLDRVKPKDTDIKGK